MATWAEFRAFLKYLFAKPINEFINLTQTFIKLKTWVLVWFAFAIIALSLKYYQFAKVSMVMALIYYLLNEWQVGDWKHMEREQLRKKIKLNYKTR